MLRIQMLIGYRDSVKDKANLSSHIIFLYYNMQTKPYEIIICHMYLYSMNNYVFQWIV